MSAFVFAGAASWYGAPKDVPTHGLYRQRVGGDRWEKLTRGLPENAEVRAIVVQPGPPATVYAGTQLGPCRSTDDGESWTLLPLPGKETVVWSILPHPRDPKTLYVGTHGTTIYRSRDGGASWQELDVPEPDGYVRMDFPGRVVRLTLDPSAPEEIYAALEVGGVVRSLDGGDSWESCNAGLLALTKDARYRNRLLSDTENEGIMDSHALTVSPAEPGTVFLANRLGLFVSRDRGRTWEDMAVGRYSPLTYARDVQVSPHDPATLHAALSVAAVSDAGSLYRSRDLGRSWQRLDRDVAIESTLMTLDASRSAPERVWCAARRGQVFGTEDGGRTWHASRLPEGCQGVYAVAAT